MKVTTTYPRRNWARVRTYLTYCVVLLLLLLSGVWLWKLLGLAALAVPLLLLALAGLALVLAGALLPPLDLSVGRALSRRLPNARGDYSVTILKSDWETAGEYELIRVDVAAGEGNDWHYHRTFEEQFEVLAGEMVIGLNGEEHTLGTGDSITAPRGQMHFFKNRSPEPAVLQVKTLPARGLEKTLRVVNGLAADGYVNSEGLPKNPWHLILLLGYSESYLKGLPGPIQEPLVRSLARVAQWLGKDAALRRYFS